MSTSSLPPFLQTSPPPIPPPTPARQKALYATTSSQRVSNPTGYKVNSQWWASVIEECLRCGWINGDDGDRLILKVDESLLRRFESYDGSRPKGFGGVVETLVQTSPAVLYPFNDFLNSITPLHAPPSLTFRFIGKPLWWVLAQLNPFGGAEEKVEKEENLWKRFGKGREYVHMSLLEQASSAFTTYLSENPILSYSTSLFDLTTFQNKFAEICFPNSGGKEIPKGEHKLSKRDIEILIKWLSRDQGLIITDGEIMKILEPSQKIIDHPINQADKGTVAIVTALSKVEEQIKSIEMEIEISTQKAKKYIGLSQKSIALSYLKSKKQLEEILSKRVISSEQLRSVLRNIDQAKGDVEIMKAYQKSTITLKKVLENPLLSMETIEYTTEGLAEVLADSEAVSEAVRIGGEVALGGLGGGVDDVELAEELEGLVREQEERERAEKEKVEKAWYREKEEQEEQEEQERRAVLEKSAEETGRRVERLENVLVPQGGVGKEVDDTRDGVLEKDEGGTDRSEKDEKVLQAE